MVNQPAEKFPDRNEYMGCSELAAAVGLNPWRTPLDVYLEKTGQVPRTDLSDNEAVYFGHVLEDVVAQEFSRRQGFKVQRQSAEIVHPRLPFLRGHIDRRIVGRRAGLECKTAGIRQAQHYGEIGTDEVPAHYLIQCAAYLSITGWDEWHLAVLIGGQDFRVYKIPRDEGLIATLEARAEAFWQAVQDRNPPDATTLAGASLLWPQDSGATVTADEDLAALVRHLRACRAEIKLAEVEADQMELEIKKALGQAATLLGPDGQPLATWRTQEARRFDSKAFGTAYPDLYEQFRPVTTSRVFRLAKEKNT